jgi:hypothetical protein
MLVKEGIDPIDLHTRAGCHRIHQWTTSQESIHNVCLGIVHDVELDPALRNQALQIQLGLTLPQGLHPKTMTQRTSNSESPVTQKGIASEETLRTALSQAASTSNFSDIPSLCTAMRGAWDRYEAVKMTSTLGTHAIVHPCALKDAQRIRIRRQLTLQQQLLIEALPRIQRSNWQPSMPLRQCIIHPKKKLRRLITP